MKHFHIKKVFANRGFTLIELLVVISIIGLLSSVVLATVNQARDKGKIAAGRTFDGHTFQAFGANAAATWNFDDSSNLGKDTSGNNNNITLAAGGVFTASSFRGPGAMNISTPWGGLVTTGFISNPTLLSKGSISFWINPANVFGAPFGGNFNGTDNFSISISSDPYSSSGHFISVDCLRGGANLCATSGGGSLATSLPASGYIGKWSHVAISWDASAGDIRIYVNGKIEAQNTFSGPVGAFSNSIIGYANGGSASANFILDEMSIYSQSLQTAQVEQLYAEGAQRHGIAVK